MNNLIIFIFIIINIRCTKELFLTENINIFSEKKIQIIGKIDLKIGSEKNKKLKFVCKIIKNKEIWISIRGFLGIEVFRLLITKEKIDFLNMIEKYFKTFTYGKISELSSFNLNYDIIQRVILREKNFSSNYFELKKNILETIISFDRVTNIITTLNKEDVPDRLLIQNFDLQNLTTNNMLGEYIAIDKAFQIYKYLNIYIKNKEFNNGKISSIDIKLKIEQVRAKNNMVLPFDIPSDYEIK